MAALASHLEGNIVGGVALDLDGAGRQVVEVLVEQLEGKTAMLAGMPLVDWPYPAHALVEASVRKPGKIVEQPNSRRWPTWRCRRRLG